MKTIWRVINQIADWLRSPLRLIWKLLILVILTQLCLYSTPPRQQDYDRVYRYTLPYEFDYISWMLDAALQKLEMFSLQPQRYMTEEQQHDLVIEYIDKVRELQIAENQLKELVSLPDGQTESAAEEDLRKTIIELEIELSWRGSLAEAVLQEQIAVIAEEYDLTFSGQPVPPPLYRSTPLPWALIVSPRDHIEQKLNISLHPDVSFDIRLDLEEQIFADLGYSALVVPVGGVGTYPTMVAQTTNLNWLAEVIAHEWIHNYLTLRPLGMNYLTSPELRTINETVASLAGIEMGQALIARFYPERVPPPPQPPVPEDDTPKPPPPPPPPAFDFRQEMFETRQTVDYLLEQEKVDRAESYMETRRQIFWDNGYRLRKINQAYFAFYGAYAASPGGAAGEDPIGEAVRTFRAGSPNLAEFINQIAWVTSFEQLQEIISETH